jgi:hypothetical protein
MEKVKTLLIKILKTQQQENNQTKTINKQNKDHFILFACLFFFLFMFYR